VPARTSAAPGPPREFQVGEGELKQHRQQVISRALGVRRSDDRLERLDHLSVLLPDAEHLREQQRPVRGTRRDGHQPTGRGLGVVEQP